MLLQCFFQMILLHIAIGDFYNPRYDDFDIKPLLENDRILIGYTKCFLDHGPCTPEAKDFKKIIPEALQSSCGKCSPKQKQSIKIIIKAIMDTHPELWNQLVNKYDNEKKYRDAFNKFIEQTD